MTAYEWARRNYMQNYATHPLANYWLTEFKNPSDAEAALVNFDEKLKRKNKNLLKFLNDFLMSFWEFLSKDRDKERMEEFLSQAKDHHDLENRMREWERRQRINKIYI